MTLSVVMPSTALAEWGCESSRDAVIAVGAVGLDRRRSACVFDFGDPVIIHHEERREELLVSVGTSAVWVGTTEGRAEEYDVGTTTDWWGPFAGGDVGYLWFEGGVNAQRSTSGGSCREYTVLYADWHAPGLPFGGFWTAPGNRPCTTLALP